jgi:hypothetical protein
MLTDPLRAGLSRFLADWQSFIQHIYKLDVADAHTIRRLVDGHNLANALGVRQGKWMGKALDICLAWQLRHPGETDASGAIEEVRRNRTDLGIPEPSQLAEQASSEQ